MECHVCRLWKRRIQITKQWWRISKKDYETLNGKDLPTFIAILLVTRKTIEEIYNGPTSKNHKHLTSKDKLIYAQWPREGCKFTPLNKEEIKEWYSFKETIRIFRNGAAHLWWIHPMDYNNAFIKSNGYKKHYKHAPYPDLQTFKDTEENYQKIHKVIRETLDPEIESNSSNIPSHEIKYDFKWVQRGPFIELIHEKMIKLLKKVKAY